MDVAVAVADGVATLTLDPPHQRNAIRGRTVADLAAALESLADDPRVRVVILTGAGDDFCVGADLAELASYIDGPIQSPEEELAKHPGLLQCSRFLREMPKITIAAVNGACAGAGISWACACDVRLAADDARFSTAFIRAGQSGDHGITWTLPRLIGMARATELMLLGERLTATEALRIGLIRSVHPKGELLSAAKELARSAAEASPRVVAAMKANLLDGQTNSFGAHLAVEARRFFENALASCDAVSSDQV